MQIWAISDLHLPSALGKSMTKFGRNWENHTRKIEENWKRKVKTEDVMLMPGDISWGKNLDESRPDYEFLASLPGLKVIVKGNHDFSLKNERKARAFLERLDNNTSWIRIIHKNSLLLEANELKIGIAGTRGWSRRGRENDDKILDRELNLMKKSLDSLPEVDRLIVLTHFPPTEEIKRGFKGKLPDCNPGDAGYQEIFDDRMFDLISEYSPSIIVCGHVHTYRIENPVNVKKIPIYCVSADAIEFDPIELPLH